MPGTLDMTQGKPAKLLVRFALPMAAGYACQLLYTVADSMVVGRLIGVGAFAAVGAAFSSYWLLVDIVLGLTQGFGTYIAQRFGAKDEQGVRGAVGNAALISLALGLVMSLLGVLFTDRVLTALNTPRDIFQDASLYLRYLIGGMLITFSYNLLATILRSFGNSTAPLMAMVMASALNILLDIGLVAFTDLGVAGVALGTLIAQAFACVYCLITLHGTGRLRLKWTDFMPHRVHMTELIRLGAPAGLRNCVISLGGLLIQRYVNDYGSLFVAGVTAPQKIYGLLEIVGASLDGAVAVFVAQNFGARDMARVKTGVNSARKLMLTGSCAIAAVVFVLGRHIMGMLVKGDPAQIEQMLRIAQNQLNCMLLGLPPLYMLFLYRSALSGMGNALFPMLSGFVELGARVASVLVLPRFIGEWGVYLAMALGWPTAALMLVIAYYAVYKRRCKELIPT